MNMRTPGLAVSETAGSPRRWRRRGPLSLLACVAPMALLIVASPAAAQPTAQDQAAVAEDSDSQADAVLRNMSDYLGKMQNLSFDYSSDVEVISQGGQTSLSGLKLQFSSHGHVMLSRPNKLRATRTASYADVELVSDGKTFSVLGKGVNAYAQANAPPTIDDLVHQFRNLTEADFPGADLLMANVYRELNEPIQQGWYIGVDDVDGFPCDHLAFRTAQVDWQIWVQRGAKPIPRKYVITSKWITGSPQYELRISNWDDNPTIAPATYSFKPPAGAKTVSLDVLEGVGDLPAPVEIGGRR